MNILDKLLGKKEIEIKTKGIEISNLTVQNSILGTLSDDISESRLLQDYKTSLYLFRGTELIVDVATSQELNLFEILNKDGEAKLIYDHEFLDLLQSPNQIQKRKQFERIMYINMLFSGETFIRLIKDDAGKLLGMYNIRPDIVDVEIKEKDGGEKIIYTVYNPNGEKKEYDKTEMLHIYKPDPQNQLRGAGVLRSLYQRVNAEKKAAELQNKTFERGGRSEGVLFVNGMDQNMADDLSRKINKSFTSANPVTVLGAESKYQQLSLTPRELEFIESMKFMRDEILLGLGIPKELITMEDGGALTNGGDRGMRLFLKFTIEPMVKLYTEAMNENILAVYYDDSLLFEPAGIVPEDRDSKIKEATELSKAGLISNNEARDLLSYDMMSGHDDLKEPYNSPVRIENAFNGRSYLLKKVLRKQAIEESKETIVKTLVDKKLKEFITVDGQYKKLYHKSMNAVTDRNIAQMERETKKYFKEQRARMQKAIDDTDEPISAGMFKINDEAVITKRLAMQVFPDIAVRSGNAGLVPVKSFYGKVNDFTIDQELIRMIEERAYLFATQVTGVTYEMIGRLVSDGLTNGLGRDEVAKSIFDMFTDMTKVRAKRIAQTEGIQMSNMGLQHSYNLEPLITGKEWITAGDGKVRDEHARNNHVIVDKNSTFPNGERFPAERTINCRCVIAPVVK